MMTWRNFGRVFAGALSLGLPWSALAAPAGGAQPGCDGIDAKHCLALAIEAMGGRAALAGIATEKLDIADHTLLTEQSYRQAPFITAYDRVRQSVDFAKSRLSTESDSLWPEADPDTASATSSSTIVATPTAAVMRAESGDTRASRATIDEARATLELGPERLLLTAEAAADLHFEAPEMLRSTSHTVLAFGWNGTPVKILINRFNHLPDAVETTQSFNDFWFAWGDVAQRIYYDNWKLIGGVVYPTNRIEERNGIVWSSAQVLGATFNEALDDKAFAMDPAAAAASTQSLGWNRPFDDKKHTQLAPGIDLYQGSWNVTLIKQDDGVVVLEAPISPKFTEGVLAKARADNPGKPVKAVLTTSDSWPHAAGVRQAVAEKLPVYVLDLNQPLLERMIAAPHRLQPDLLQTAPQRADWHMVAGKTEIGTGANRIVLYPLRGAATERQYMAYFPEHRLLYASDTLAIDPDKHSLYDPELMREVVQAATREGLKVDTVYAMHEGPTAWSEATRMVTAAEGKS